MEIARWITWKGKHLPVGADGKIMKKELTDDWGNKKEQPDNSVKLSKQEYKKLKNMKEKDFYKRASEERFINIKIHEEANADYYNMAGPDYDGQDIEYIQLTNENRGRDTYYEDRESGYKGIKDKYGYVTMGNYKDTTQKELDNLPVSFTTYIPDPYTGRIKEYTNIYKNSNEMNKDIKKFGSIKEYTGGNRYSIKSESGIGDYYRVRNPLYKNAHVWEDENGNIVYGAEYMDHSKREKKWEERSREFRKHIEEEYGITYEEWLKGGK